MSPLLALGLLVAGLCPTVHCVPGGVLDPQNVTQEDLHNETPVDNLGLASSNTDFALSLYKQLASKTPNENVIFSPLSVSIALAFLSLGAQGSTLTEILEGLKFNLTETPDAEIHRGFQHLLRTLRQPSNELQLSVGNAMFVSEQLKLLEKFTADARALYAAEAFSTNFQDSAAAERLINDYVKNRSRGKIVDLVKDLDLNTAMVLVNYIFLKGECLACGLEGIRVLVLSLGDHFPAWCSKPCYWGNHHRAGALGLGWGEGRRHGTEAPPCL